MRKCKADGSIVEGTDYSLAVINSLAKACMVGSSGVIWTHENRCGDFTETDAVRINKIISWLRNRQNVRFLRYYYKITGVSGAKTTKSWNSYGLKHAFESRWCIGEYVSNGAAIMVGLLAKQAHVTFSKARDYPNCSVLFFEI